MRKLVLALFAAIASAGLEAAPAPWLEVKSPHFTVITNAGEKQGRRTAWQFEQIRIALVNLWPWAKIDSGRPFVVFAARDETTLKTLGPQYWEGKQFRPVSFGNQGRDRQFLALRTDVAQPDEQGANPYQSAYWSYTSAVFTRSFPRRLPAWYSRGMAEVMSNTIVRDKELHVGRPMAENLERLRQYSPIPLSEFLSAEGRSRWLTQLEDVWLFDAQAWALVHYLLFGDKGVHLRRVDRFNRLLYDGTAAPVAVQEAFGDMRPYYDGMRQYVQRNLFSYARVPVSVDTRLEAYASRPLSAGEAAVLRGELLVAMNRPAEARAFAAEAAKADSSLPGPWEIEAELADADDRRDEARAAFAKAAAAGSKRAHVYYRLAQLEWVKDADKTTLERLASTLEKAREMEPGSARTLSFLADIRSGLGQHDEALALARKAVEAEPAESYHRLTLARALWNARQREQAVQMARSALQAADDDSERQRAQSFLDFAARSSTPPPAPNTPDVSTTTGVGAPAAAPSAAAFRVVGGLRGADDLAACFERRDDRACGQAVSVLDAACEAAQPVACRSLGSLYDGGFGVTPDKTRAGVAYGRGCRGGDRASCARYAVLQAQGQGVARDTAQGLTTLQRLCAEPVDDACIGWALVLASASAKAELAKARELLRATCDRKNEEACRLLKSLPR